VGALGVGGGLISLVLSFMGAPTMVRARPASCLRTIVGASFMGALASATPLRLTPADQAQLVFIFKQRVCWHDTHIVSDTTAIFWLEIDVIAV